MKKFSKKIAEHILAMIRADTHTISEVCKCVGISRQTFYNWQNENLEFAEAIEQANEERMQFFAVEAKKSLLKMVQGYEVTETRVAVVPDENGKPKVKEQTTTKKHVQPDTKAIIFTLTNGDPARWRNKKSTEITGNRGKDLFSKMTDEEVEKELAKLNRILNG